MLNALNEDCRRHVLSFVPVEDILRAEHLIEVLRSSPLLTAITDQVIQGKKLKQLSFWYLNEATDDVIGKFLGIGNDNLEEFIIFSNQKVTGRCLANINSTNLKSLGLMKCKNLELCHILSALESLTGLTSLELTLNNEEIFKNAHLVIKKVPNLRELTLIHDKQVEMKGNIPEAMSRLNSLKCTHLTKTPNVTDEWLKEMASGCKQLEVLNVAKCNVSAQAVKDFCRASGSALKVLNVASIGTMDDKHSEDCINSCPNLEDIEDLQLDLEERRKNCDNEQ